MPTDDRSTSYAEFAGWELLSLVIENLTGTSAEVFIFNELIAPLGLAEHIAFSTNTFSAMCGNLRINTDNRGEQRIPILWERSTSRTMDPIVATGAFASMTGLATLYDAIASTLMGNSVLPISGDVLAHFVSPLATSAFDKALGRPSTFGLGFMSNLPIGCFAEREQVLTYGHTGLGGMTVGGTVLASGVSLAVHVNALLDADGGNQSSLLPTSAEIALAIVRELNACT